MSSLVKDVGAVAGLASFLGLALLALLYFTQARDVRRLRERASFLVEGGTDDGETVAPAERAATAVATKEPEKAPRPRQPRPPTRPRRSGGRSSPGRLPNAASVSSSAAGAPAAGVSAPPGSRSRCRWPRS